MDLLLWLLAIPVSVAIGYIFFRKSGKALSFYLLVDDQPLSKVDASVRERLNISFSYPKAPNNQGLRESENEQLKIVGNLHHLQVVIYNSGLRAITFTEPPTIEIPRTASILDASVIYQKPSDLGASIVRLPVEDDKDQTVRLAVRMLNKGEFVVIKFLLSEAIDAHKLKVHLLAEELERSIPIKRLPAEATKPVFEEASLGAITFGFICLFSAAAAGAVTTAMLKMTPLPNLMQVGIWKFIKNFSLINGLSILAFVAVFILLIFGLVIGFGLGMQPIFRRHRIVLPAGLRPTRPPEVQ